MSWWKRTSKRIDMWSLRWQARLEGNGVDSVGPWFIASVVFVGLLGLSLARSRSLDDGATLAEYSQTSWLIGEGFQPISSLADGNILADKLSLVMYPIAFLAAFLPTVTTLLVVQSLALALGVVPLWRIARRTCDLKIGPTAAVLFAYGASSAVHNLNLAGFHPEVVALPAILAAVYAGLQERWIRFALLVVVILAARADLGLVVVGLGILLVMEGRKRAGWVTAIAGIGWFGLAALAIQPDLAGGNYLPAEAFSTFADGNAMDVLFGFFAHPVQFFERVGSRSNFATLVGLLAPVLFLPVVAPRYLLPALPVYSLYLVADVPEGRLLEAPQAIPIVAFIFVATIFALQRSGTVRVSRVNVDRRLLWALIFMASVFFIRDSASSPYESPWSWGSRDATDQQRITAAAQIPPEDSVRASPKVLPLLFERERLYELDTSLVGDPSQNGTVDVAVDRDVDWIILDLTEVDHWTALERQLFDLGLGIARDVGSQSERFERVYRDGDLIIYSRVTVEE